MKTLLFYDNSNIGLVILLVIFCAWIVIPPLYSHYNDIKRNNAWQQFAKRYGFSYKPTDNVSFFSPYHDHFFFTRVAGWQANNICQKNEKGMDICVFDFQFHGEGGYKRNPQYFVYTIVVINMPMFFKTLYIRREELVDKVLETVEEDSIKFESAEFSRYYLVRCEEKKFAYDIIHPDMMEYLLTCKPMTIECENQTVVFHRLKKLPVSDVEVLYQEALKFISLIPEYILKENVILEKKGHHKS